MVPDQGANIVKILEEAGRSSIEDQNSKTGIIRLGRGSELESTSWSWIRGTILWLHIVHMSRLLIGIGMTTVVGNGLIKLRLIEQAEFDRLQLEVLEEVKSEGVEIKWFATWARKI